MNRQTFGGLDAKWSLASVEDWAEILPDPRVIDTLGRNHTFEEAIADLVDNSIEAEATSILIRFVRDDEKVQGLYIVDDGHGMTEREMTTAMTVGGQRRYSATSLGHFGVGLKAASLGQASRFQVYSKSKRSQVAVGRVGQRSSDGRTYEVGRLKLKHAESVWRQNWSPIALSSGTIVRWDGLRNFGGANARAVGSLINRKIESLKDHLGLVFHRFIGDRQVTILIDVVDARSGESGAPQGVDALDPFGYAKTGHREYPKRFNGKLGGQSVEMHCHIWPPRSQVSNFKLGWRSVVASQGFYFYRNGRLLQAGGWNGVVVEEPALQLARVRIDIDDGLAESIQMNAEKTRVTTGEDFGDMVMKSKGPAKSTWSDFIEDARTAFKSSQQRDLKRKPVVEVGDGFSPFMKRVLRDQVDFMNDEEPISISWGSTNSWFMDVDKIARTVVLNKKYRSLYNGDRRGSKNDAAVLKTLVFLLVQEAMQGKNLGPRDRDNLDFWNEVLTSAMEEEIDGS